jgi:internalin A
MFTHRISRTCLRYVRFSVRGLIVLVLAIGAWLGWIVNEAHVERDAVLAIKAAGGRLDYDWEWSNGKPIQRGEPWAPQWLVNLIGVDFFGHVTLVHIDGSSTATNATMEHVGRLTRLEWLNLLKSSIGDAGLNHVMGLTKLKQVNLNSTGVSDSGLVNLEGLSSLSSLSPRPHARHRRRAGPSEGVQQTLRPNARQHAGHRRRPRAFEGAEQPVLT